MVKIRSPYPGITWDEKRQKWKAQITVGGKKYHLGRFVDEWEAAQAYSTAKALKEVSVKTIKKDRFLDPDQCRVGILDIETSGLRSDFGICYCAVIKTFGTSEECIFQLPLEHDSIFMEEKEMITDINNSINTYDGIATFYGSKFDIPFLRTRSFIHGLEPVSKLPHLDMYFTIKSTVNPSTRRMDRINELLRISNPDNSPVKTRIDIHEWNKILLDRDKQSLGYIVDHCDKDVDILENIMVEFRDFIPERITRK